MAFEIPADVERRLPRGRVEVSAFFAAAELRARVDAVYVAIPEHGNQVKDSKAFDDGAVVIDTDSRGRPLGVELTTVMKGLPDLPEFARHVDKNRAELAATMLVTGLRIARRFDLGLVDAMATLRALVRQLEDQGIQFQIDEVRLREAIVEVVKSESRWMPEAISA